MSVARSGERVLGSADAQLGGAGGPGSPALRGLGLLGDVDLLGTGGLVRGGGVLAAPEGLPGGAGELQSAVVPVAGVDRPVAAGLALGQTVPHGAVGDRRCGSTGVAGALGAARGLARAGALGRVGVRAFGVGAVGVRAG